MRTLALVTISIELLGVLVVGTLSLLAPGVLGLHSLDPFGRDVDGVERIRRRLPARAARAAGARPAVPARPIRPTSEGLTVQFFDGLGEVPAGFGPSAVTIGKFDGVHLGHRSVLRQLRELADERGLTATVVTFDRNPLATARPREVPG